MAIIKLGGTVVGIRGSIGGVTYSANKSGAYVKAWKNGPNQQSPKQTRSRSFLASAGAAWNGMTPAQRTAWDTYAANAANEQFNSLGEGYFMSGFNIFTRENIFRFQTGQTTFNLTPLLFTPTTNTVNSLTYAVGGPPTTTLILNGTVFASRTVVVFSKLLNSIGQKLAYPPFQYLYSEIDQQQTTIDLTAAVQALYGTAASGTQLFVRVFQQRTPNGTRSVGSDAYATAP